LKENLLLGYLPVILFMVVCVVLTFVLAILSQLLGRKNPNPEKNATYECGVPPIKDARMRFDVRFYLVAMLFLLFDIEVVFLYPWAVVVGNFSPIIFGLVEMILFMAILLFGYVYIWRKGALDWR
jgi:NADH-quinone oxidoreductase subunit A